MAVERLWSLEGKVERLQLALDALSRRVAALSQQLWQQAGSGGQGGGGGPVRIRITAGIAAGAIGTPSSASAFLLLPNGSDGQSITLKSEFATAVTGSKFGWAMQIGSDYNLVQADC